VNPLGRVLTAVDFSEPARAAFDHALGLSGTHDAELTAVRRLRKELS
jgi:nucleotide-binding universal stress UspA family protein